MKDIRGAIKRIWRQYFSIPKYWRYEFGAIGKHTRIGEECVLVPKNMYLDDYVVIQNRVNFVSLDGKLIVKKFSVISTQTIIVPGTHAPIPGIPFYYPTTYHVGDDHSTITIEEDCWIGAGSILLMKSSVGRGAIVAAGSVVTKAVPPYAVVAGNPARVIAVKFSKEDILRHEEAIYPPAERMTEAQIDALFDASYRGVKVMEGKTIEQVGKRYDREAEGLVDVGARP